MDGDWRAIVGRNAYNPHLMAALVAGSALAFTTVWAAVWTFLIPSRISPVLFLRPLDPPLLGFAAGIGLVTAVAYATSWRCWRQFVTNPGRMNGKRAKNVGIVIGFVSYLVLVVSYLAPGYIFAVVTSNAWIEELIALAPSFVGTVLIFAALALLFTAGIPILLSVYVTTRVARLHRRRAV